MSGQIIALNYEHAPPPSLYKICNGQVLLRAHHRPAGIKITTFTARIISIRLPQPRDPLIGNLNGNLKGRGVIRHGFILLRFNKTFSTTNYVTARKRTEKKMLTTPSSRLSLINIVKCKSFSFFFFLAKYTNILVSLGVPPPLSNYYNGTDETILRILTC